MTETNTAQLGMELQATDEAVRAQGWVAPGLGRPNASLGLLGSTFNPLSGLAAAGLGWFMPFVSFLGDGLAQLQGGNAASVSSGSQEFSSAGQDIAGVADSYRNSTTEQTANWSGSAAADYRDAGAQHADGVAGLGQGSNTTASAIIGAGQVVAQAVAEVTELIAEAVAEIVPIMTQAVARAPETYGQSVVEAIPPCVGIAVTYAARIVAKLAALLASGDNLLKLVNGGMAVVELIQQAMSSISQQSVQASSQTSASASGGVSPQGATAAASVDSASKLAAGNPDAGGSSSPMSAGGGRGYGGPPDVKGGGAVRPQGTHSWTPPATQSAGAIPPRSSALDVPRSSTGSTPAGGALPLGAAARGASSGSGARTGSGARVGRGGESGKQEETRRPASSAGGGGGGRPFGAMPMGAMGARGAGAEDKEHQRKYRLTERHDDVFDIERVLPAELDESLPTGTGATRLDDDAYFASPPEITR